MSQGWGRKDVTFPASLQHLAQIAVRYVGAEGCAIYQINSKSGLRELRYSEGFSVPPNPLGAPAMDSYPLQVDGIVCGLLAFVFHEEKATHPYRVLLERVARAIESVWRLSLIPDAYARKAARAGELEVELADCKIADRARGMLSAGSISEEGVNTILRHVENVLRPGQIETALSQITLEVEQQIVERALTTRAKGVLQTRYGMSEDQAHAHLRNISRKSRKRLRDVASDLLQEISLDLRDKEQNANKGIFWAGQKGSVPN